MKLEHKISEPLICLILGFTMINKKSNQSNNK